MAHPAGVLLSLFVVYVTAQIAAEVAQRLRLPAVVGQIVGGCIVGPSVLGWVKMNDPLEMLAELGVILLLFSVGLETRLHELKRVGKTAFSVGLFGVIAPFALGAIWAVSAGFPTPKAMFVAAAFVATSAGITAKVLKDMGKLDGREARIILGAAVIDDVLAMLLLAVVSGLQTPQGVDLANLLKVLGQAVGFVLVVAIIGSRIMRRSSALLDAPIDPDSPLTLALVLCLGLAVLASSTGLAAIIGAFLAGMILAETDHREALEHQTRPILALLVPFFFVETGAKIDVRLLSSPSMLGTVAIVTLLAIVGKLVGGWLGARRLGFRSASIVGVGMIPRGEVGIIVASLGRQAQVFSDDVYALVVAMSLATSIVAPPILGRLMRQSSPE